jgi:quercetin dioxygenase-like cupin family protein
MEPLFLNNNRMNPQQPQNPVTKRADNLENAYWYGGSLMNVLVDGSKTNGRYAQIEATMQPGTEPPAHTHTREDETFYLLEGAIRFTIGEHVFTAHAGDYVLMPKNIPHSFKILTPTAKAVLTIAPAGFENYFRDPRLAIPAPSLTLPPAPQGPPPAHVIETIGRMLDEEYGVKMKG